MYSFSSLGASRHPLVKWTGSGEVLDLETVSWYHVSSYWTAYAVSQLWRKTVEACQDAHSNEEQEIQAAIEHDLAESWGHIGPSIAAGLVVLEEPDRKDRKYCCLPIFGRCGRSEDRGSVDCPLANPFYPAEWMAETQFRTVDPHS